MVAQRRGLKNVVQLQLIETAVRRDLQSVVTAARPMRLAETRVGVMQSIHRLRVLKA